MVIRSSWLYGSSHFIQRICLLSLALSSLPAMSGQQANSSISPRIADQIGQSQQSSVTEIQSLISHGRSDDAEKQLNALALQRPEPPEVERLLGMIYYQRNNFAAADAAFGKAIEQNGQDRRAIEMRGVTLYRLGQPAAAIPLLEAGNNSVSVVNSDTTYVLALCYMDTRRYDDARLIFARQYGFPDNSAPSYLLLARMLLRRSYSPEAHEMATRALAVNPKLPGAHLLLGQIALSSSRVDESIEEFERERKINPLNGEVYERLGDSYISNAKYLKAQQLLDRAVTLEPNSTGPYILLGQVSLKREQPMLALGYLKRAAAMDESNYRTHLLLGEAYRATGRALDAKREFQAAQRLQKSAATQ
jgi:tetratricopeptide (TPR) repeat protein